MSDDEQARMALRSYQRIMTATRRGAISPQGALTWARRAAAGEDVSVLDILAAPPPEVRAAAGDPPGLGQRVLDILMRLLEQGGPDESAVDPEFRPLFPPTSAGEHYETPRTSLVYDGDDQGQPDRSPRPATANPHMPYASDGSRDYAAGAMTDSEADKLWPPKSISRAEARHAELEAKAGHALYYSDDELYDLLWATEGWT